MPNFSNYQDWVDNGLVSQGTPPADPTGTGTTGGFGVAAKRRKAQATAVEHQIPPIGKASAGGFGGPGTVSRQSQAFDPYPAPPGYARGA